MREQHRLGQLGFESLGGFTFPVDRSVDQSGRDGVHADTRRRQVAGDRQGQTHDATLGGRVGGLADLAVEGRDAGDVDDRAALACVGQLVAAHGGGGQPDAVERADQVDGEHLLVGVQVVRRVELAVLADGPLGPADAGRVDQGTQRAEVDGGVDRVQDLIGVGDVDGDEDATDLVRELPPAFGVEVGDDDPGALGGQLAGRGRTDAGRATGDDCASSVDIHVDRLNPVEWARPTGRLSRRWAGQRATGQSHTEKSPGG
jgi:hypothetical protein